MTHEMIIYGIGGLCVVLGAALILVRERLLMQLTAEQTRLIFGVEEALEVDVPLSQVKRVTLKMRVHYPSLLFLVAGIGAVIFTYETGAARISSELEQVRQELAGLKSSQSTVTWTIVGTIERPPGPAPVCVGRNCPGQAPVMAIIPPGYSMTVHDGSFSLEVTIPTSKTFEEAVAAIQYRHGCEYFSIDPLEALQDRRGNKPSPLAFDAELKRRYVVPVEIDQECQRQEGGR